MNGERIDAYFTSRAIHLTAACIEALAQHASNLPLPTDDATRLKLCTLHWLTTDITQSVSPTCNTAAVTQQQHDTASTTPMYLSGVFQIVAVRDIGMSAVAALERIERAEESLAGFSRRIIRLDDDDDDNDDGVASQSAGTIVPKSLLKVTLQAPDATCVYAIEQTSITGLAYHSAYGAKLILQHAKYLHGVVLLTPHTVSWLGGTFHHGHGSSSGGEQSTLRARKSALMEEIRALPAIPGRAQDRDNHDSDEAWLSDGGGGGIGASHEAGRGRGRGRGARGTSGRGRSRGRRRGSGASRGRGRGK